MISQLIDNLLSISSVGNHFDNRFESLFKKTVTNSQILASKCEYFIVS